MRRLENIERIAAALLGPDFMSVEVYDCDQNLLIRAIGRPKIERGRLDLAIRDAVFRECTAEVAVRGWVTHDEFAERLCVACEKIKADHAEFRQKHSVGYDPHAMAAELARKLTE